MLSTLAPSAIIAANHRQLAKISWKKREAMEISTAIATFFADNDVPLTKDVGKEFEEFAELSRYYHALRGTNKSIVADFAQGGEHRPMLLAHWYSRHRYDPVWLMRKSQLIRKKYREFLSTHEVAPGRLLIREYTPIHMVLTLPHAGGQYQGERFYARKLLAAFAELRRTKYFKRCIYGGEYGLEIKKSPSGNGLHIHLHSLCFLIPEENQSPEKIERWLQEKWKRLTGATECHFEPLYCFKKDDAGKYIQDWTPVGKTTTVGRKTVRGRKKFYIDTDSPIDEYLKGVMECIKYHFKGDSMKDAYGDWDVPLMMDVLNNSRNLRFYSRFGAFYKQPALNFNDAQITNDEPPSATDLADLQQCEAEEEFWQTAPIESAPEWEEQATEERIMGSAAGVDETLRNPFTGLLARREDYRMCVVDPAALHFDKGHRLKMYDPDHFHPVGDAFSLRDVISSVCRGRARDVAAYGGHSSFAEKMRVLREEHLLYGFTVPVSLTIINALQKN